MTQRLLLPFHVNVTDGEAVAELIDWDPGISLFGGLEMFSLP